MVFQGARFKKTELEKQEKIEKGQDVFPVRCNVEDREMLNMAKRVLAVDRDSTALKELAHFGWSQLQDRGMATLFRRVLVRLRRGYADTIKDFGKENEENPQNVKENVLQTNE